MKIRRILAVASAALMVAASPARAWDGTGHKAVARIAWDNLTPQTRAQAMQILNTAPFGIGIRELRPAAGTANRDRTYFMRVATWADNIRPDTAKGHAFHERDTHFRDQFFETLADGTVRDRPDLPPQGDLLRRMQVFSDSLAAPSISRSRRARYLAWLLHLVGDIHQPLHSTGHLPPPGGDQGGNLFPLSGSPRNLHSYWDQTLTRNFGANPNDIAVRLESRHPKSSVGPLKPGNFAAWADEGFQASKSEAYVGIKPNDNPRDLDDYRARNLRVAETAIARAGYRLADLLNAKFGS